MRLPPAALLGGEYQPLLLLALMDGAGLDTLDKASSETPLNTFQVALLRLGPEFHQRCKSLRLAPIGRPCLQVSVIDASPSFTFCAVHGTYPDRRVSAAAPGANQPIDASLMLMPYAEH